MDKFRNKYRIPSARAQWWDYGRDAAYFITICTKDRKFYFGDVIQGLMELSETGIIAKSHWLKIPEHFPFVQLGAFIVMPNHIHGILIIKQTANSIALPDETPEMDMECGNISGGGECGNISGGGDCGNISGGGECTDAQFGRLSESSESSESSELSQLSQLSQSHKKSGGNKPQWHSGTIGVIINQYKRICTINARKTEPDFGWQSRFHDHIIRNSMEFERIANYIKNNPANWKNDKFKDPGK